MNDNIVVVVVVCARGSRGGQRSSILDELYYDGCSQGQGQGLGDTDDPSEMTGTLILNSLGVSETIFIFLLKILSVFLDKSLFSSFLKTIYIRIRPRIINSTRSSPSIVGPHVLYGPKNKNK